MASPAILSEPPGLIPTLKLLGRASTFADTLYLFTASDFPTFALPTTLFAVCASLSGPLLTTNPSPSLFLLLFRAPLALLLVWSNLLIFNISNQRSVAAVQEDRVNKPHRPLPSGKLTRCAARRILLAAVPIVLGFSWCAGCWEETLLLFAATWAYNDLGGSDENWVLRNALIAVGYGLYSSAALRVLAGPVHGVTERGRQWVGVVTMVMFATQHVCDIKDVEGDRGRGRRSAPVVLGDVWVRWSVCVPVLLASVLCPAFLGLEPRGYVGTMVLGGVVAARTLRCRSLRADKLTWKLWALWTCVLFMLPLVKSPDALIYAWKELRLAACFGEVCSGALNLVAVSGVALVVEGRRVFGQMGIGGEENGTRMPEIVVDVVT